MYNIIYVHIYIYIYIYIYIWHTLIYLTLSARCALQTSGRAPASSQSARAYSFLILESSKFPEAPKPNSTRNLRYTQHIIFVSDCESKGLASRRSSPHWPECRWKSKP